MASQRRNVGENGGRHSRKRAERKKRRRARSFRLLVSPFGEVRPASDAYFLCEKCRLEAEEGGGHEAEDEDDES